MLERRTSVVRLYHILVNGTPAQPNKQLAIQWFDPSAKILKVSYTNCDQLLKNKFDEFLTLIYCGHPDIY